MADNSNPQRRSKRSRRDDPKMIGAWKLGKTIGKGSSGSNHTFKPLYPF